MRKFLLPIINLVNVILVSIIFGLGANTALTGDTYPNRGNWYSLVWEGYLKTGADGKQIVCANVVGIIGFFLFVIAVAGILVAFLPVSFRKWVNVGVGAALIAAGVLFLLTPNGSMRNIPNVGEITDSLIAMAVLAFVSGAFSLGMAALEIVPMFKKAN